MLDKSVINTLAKKREVPYEIMFKLSDAEQDPIKKNRYWFDFPGQWVNQLDKDAIIGIRDIYLTKTNRHIRLLFNISVVEENTNTSRYIMGEYSAFLKPQYLPIRIDE